MSSYRFLHWPSRWLPAKSSIAVGGRVGSGPRPSLAPDLLPPVAVYGAEGSSDPATRAGSEAGAPMGTPPLHRYWNLHRAWGWSLWTSPRAGFPPPLRVQTLRLGVRSD